MFELNTLERVVLYHVWSRDGLSRTDLTRLARLSKATISRVVSQLLKKNLISESPGEKLPGRGRPATSLSLEKNSTILGGVYIRSNAFDVSIGDLSGRLRKFFSVSHRRSDVEEGLERLPSELLKRGVEPAELAAFSVVTPGIVQTGPGEVSNAFYTQGKKINLKSLLGELNGRTVIENDANALVYSQLLFGSLRQTDILYIDKGFGSTLVLDGKIFRGPHGNAGEFGHMQLDPHGPLCWCGKRGCLSTYFSLESLHERFGGHLDESELKLPERALVRNLSRRYAGLDAESFKRAFEELLDVFAAAIVNVVDFLGIETVLLNNQNPVYNAKTFKYLNDRVLKTALKHDGLKLESVTVTTEGLMLVPIAVALSNLLEKQEVKT